jgi:hypothetical protein
LGAGRPRLAAAVREHGHANRRARQGETARLRPDDRPVVVVDPGTGHDRGHYVRVRFTDAGDETVVRLSALHLAG